MKINNLSVVFKWRLFGFVLSFFMAVAANMYLEIPLLYMLTVWHFMFMAIFYIRKDSPRIKALNESCRNNLRLIKGALLVSCIIGFVAFLGEARLEERIVSLLFPVVALDLIMSVLFLLFSYSHSKWQRVGPVSGPAESSAMYGGNGGIATAYPDSDYSATDYDWPQSDYHTSAVSDSSLGVNPASGLPMINDAMDIAGNVYGFGEPTFPSYDHHTNQFSDFDYHNNP